MKKIIKPYLYFLLVLFSVNSAHAERIKDLAHISGVRSNALIGYGLVVGLDGSGDKTGQAPFTAQSLRSMLGELGVTIPPNIQMQSKNVAAVAIHAELPPFARPGQKIDITVSSIGNASSLRGGSLLMAPLKGADGEVYAIAQGNLVVGGLGVQGRDGSKLSVNIPSVGRIPGGATVERALPEVFANNNEITFYLNQSDFTTTARMVTALNNTLGAGSARAIDGGSIIVQTPTDNNARVDLLARIENIELTPGSAPAKVIINARTGTVVMGGQVRVRPAAISHGSLTVTVTESAQVSQPNALGNGQTVVVPQSSITASHSDGRMFYFAGGVTLEEIVRAVNAIGAAPGDLVAILEALKQAGALTAELEVI